MFNSKALVLHPERLEFKSQVGLIIFVLVLLSAFDKYVDGLRYLKYVIPMICITVLISNKFRIQVDESTRPFIFLVIATLLWAPTSNIYGISDLYFYITSLAPFLVGCIPRLRPQKMFVILSGVFVALFIPGLIAGGDFQYSLLDSKSSLESHSFAFVFGLFSIYFFLTKDKKYFVFSLIMAILVLKRISLLSIVVVIAIYQLSLFLNFKRMVIFGVSLNILYILFSKYITTDSFNYFSQDVFGVSSAFLTMGRTVLYEPIFALDRGLIEIFFGSGPGSSYLVAAASIFIVDGKVNLHSDVLKFYYELGVFVLLTFLVLAYKVKGILIYLFIYINIVLFTDNISTYATVMYVYFYLATMVQENDRSLLINRFFK